MVLRFAFLIAPATPVFGQWGADSQPTRNTSAHGKRIIGYVTPKEITAAMSASPPELAGFDWPTVSNILDSIQPDGPHRSRLARLGLTAPRLRPHRGEHHF